MRARRSDARNPNRSWLAATVVMATVCLLVSCGSSPVDGARSVGSSMPGSTAARRRVAPTGSAPPGTVPISGPTTNLGFQVDVGGGSFRQDADGTIHGTLTDVAKATWSSADGARRGEVEGAAALKVGAGAPNHASIQVKGAGSAQDLVSLEFQSLSYDSATGRWNYAAKPLDAKANTAARLTGPSFAADADPALGPTFGAATVAIDNRRASVGPDGGPAPNDVIGGNLMFSLGPGVSVTARLVDSSCVDTQSAPIFESKAMVDKHPFQADMFTFDHGCGTVPSWVLWELTIGPPWSVSGELWLGQKLAGQDYQTECHNWPDTVACEPSGFYESDSATNVMIGYPKCPEEGEPHIIEKGSCTTAGTESVFAGNIHGTGTVWNGGFQDCSIPGVGTVPVFGSLPFERYRDYRPDIACGLLMWQWGD